MLDEWWNLGTVWKINFGWAWNLGIVGKSLFGIFEILKHYGTPQKSSTDIGAYFPLLP